MSRKREEQRESKKELARQLGVKGLEVPDSLLQNERVTEPSVSAALVVDTWPRAGLLAMFKTSAPAGRDLDVHAALWCVSSHRARLVRSARWGATVTGPGPVTLSSRASSSHDHDVVRYKRPGFFVLVVAASEGRGEAGALADAAWIAAFDGVTIDGAKKPFDALSTMATSSLPPTALPSGITGAWGTFVVARAAADRVKEQLAFSLRAPDGKVEGTLTVSLRL